MAKIPVAPIHYVERADGEWRGIFEKAAGESVHVLPAWNILAVSSRVHRYTEGDFALIEKLLNELIPKHFPQQWQTPAKIWSYLIDAKPEGEATWIQRAVAAYEQIIANARQARAGG